MTTDEIKNALREIDSSICRLSMEVLDQDPWLAHALVSIAPLIMALYKGVEYEEKHPSPPDPKAN